MADKTQKVPENVPGKWYVDETCTPCHTCMEEAANLLKYNEDETKVYFFKQPANAETEQQTFESAQQPSICTTIVSAVEPTHEAAHKPA